MIREALTSALAEAAANAAPALGLDPAALPEPELERPRQRDHGDWATNLALVLAPKAGRPPREVAEAVVAAFPSTPAVEALEVAGPGFINIRLRPIWLHDVLRNILESGDAYGLRQTPRDRRVQVEFVSANPTGPLHVGHARNTVLGDAIASVLEADGYGVEREYYWNDTGTQMELLGESVEARYLARFGVAADVPEDGYQGEYVDDVAAQIAEAERDRFVHAAPDTRRAWFVEESRRRMIEWIRGTLDRFGVHFDSWFSEATLEESGAIDEAVKLLREGGFAYD